MEKKSTCKRSKAAEAKTIKQHPSTTTLSLLIEQHLSTTRLPSLIECYSNRRIHSNKEELIDVLHIKYHLAKANLPTQCSCGKKFDKQHAISCSKIGVLHLSHNKLQDIFAVLLHEVYYDTNAAQMLSHTANKSPLTIFK